MNRGRRETRQDRVARNKRAFDDVFGDPFTQPEAIPGYYNTLKNRGPIAATRSAFLEGKATRNPATPNLIDFFCDAERVLSTVLTDEELKRFYSTYIFENNVGFSQDERSDIEQRVGQKLRDNKISPVTKYFTSIRRSIHDTHRRGGNCWSSSRRHKRDA